MQQKTMRQRLLQAWITGVLTLSLAVIAACGGATSEAPAEETAAESAPTEEVAAEADSAEAADSGETEAAETAAAEDEAPAEDEEAAATEADESSAGADEEAVAAVPAVEVTCTPLEIPSFDQISGPTESDWALGPETASATIIEYGDFQ